MDSDVEKEVAGDPNIARREVQKKAGKRLTDPVTIMMDERAKTELAKQVAARGPETTNLNPTTKAPIK